MNREQFKEEFTKILCQFAIPAQDNHNPSVAPLTKQEIIDAVQDVLDAKLDVTLVDLARDSVRTPAAGIVTTTPNAPDIPKISVDRNGDIPERFQSLDSLVAESLTNSSNDQLSLPDIDMLTSNMEENTNGFAADVPDARFNDKKFMSKSSPAVSTLVRSETFVRDDEFQSVENGDIFGEKKIGSTATNGSGSEHSLPGINLIEIFKKMKALKDCAADMINKIDDIQKDAPDAGRPIRRLSAMGNFPGCNRTSKLTRRSLAAFDGTPTSSRLSLPAVAKVAPPRSKSSSTGSLVHNVGSKLTLPSTYRSVSSGTPILPKTISLPQASQPSGVKTQKTLGLRSPSLSLVNVSDRSANHQSIKQVANVSKTGIVLGKRKANQ